MKNTDTEATISYAVYEYEPIMGTKSLALKKTIFPGFTANAFETEVEAIKAICSQLNTYTEYVILREVFITIKH